MQRLIKYAKNGERFNRPPLSPLAARTGEVGDGAPADPPLLLRPRLSSEESASAQSGRVAEPRPPTPPSEKVGFAFEWAFPLSVRTE